MDEVERAETDPEFEELIRFIQESRGLDFRGYKRTSLRRRIRRRMEEVGRDDVPGYQAFLEAHPQEIAHLLDTVLINVTSFFRDAPAWEVLAHDVLPRILQRKPEGQIRVWSAGCASGEEPYSLAMLFAERLGAEEFCRRVKIYGTDLDEDALQTARQASYGAREVEGVPPELLERYFERAEDRYVIQRDLRKCVIFGRHNVVSDAPISRIDLLTCRNLLIYLETDTQAVVLPRLHYALADGGYMFLGKAETQLTRSKLFEPVDLKSRIFRKLPQTWRRTAGGGLLTVQPTDRRPQEMANRLPEAILDGSSVAYLAVDEEGRLAFANAAARRLLCLGEADLGRPFQDLSVSYRPVELRSRMEEAWRAGRPVRIEHAELPVRPGESIRLSIEVAALTDRDGTPYATLIGFDDTTRFHALQQELEGTRESLETTIEELQSANEELETTNEELQSTNEELETMNEELRSANEELEVANEELRRQGEESASFRLYWEAVLRSVDVGVIVVGQDLAVRSWNRWCENAWGLRSEEVVGEGFLDLDIGLPVQQLRAGLRQAMDEGRPTEAAVDAVDRRGRQFRCRVRLSPLVYDGRKASGVVLLTENAAG